MPDPIEPPAPPAELPTPPASVPPQEPPTDALKIFSQDDVNRLITKRLDEEKEKTRKQAQKDKDAAEEARLKEAGEYKILAEQKDGELTDLRNQVAAKELENLRIKVGAKYRLPDNLTKRLIGTTEAELEKDAAEVAKDVVPPSPGNTMNGGGYQPNSGKLTQAQFVEKTKQEQIGTGRYNL